MWRGSIHESRRLSAMTRRILPIAAAFSTLAFVSCYPYPEPPPGHGPTAGQTVTSPEQQKIEAERKRLKEAEEAAKRKEIAETPPTTPGGESANTTPKPPVREKKDYPFATSVPGKEGFVFSPYNQKVIDVREIQSGTLVQDPTYPPAEKKYFRVP
jgi:hypothetical protein